jgi:predicted acyl esterase
MGRGANPKRYIENGVTLERDVAVVMGDGPRLMVNVFRPVTEARLPVILSVTPYGKDALPDRRGMTFMRLAGVRFGKLDCSRWTGFEAPDPLFWARAGYAVAQADARGMHKSEGRAGLLTNDDARDYCALIDWAARQPWSSGLVGLLGVSYLAMSQWRAAALRPPALKAICPWEGVTDLLRELAYQDGVPETGFLGVWWNVRMKRGRNRRFVMAEDFLQERDRHPLDDGYWATKRPALDRIDVPALVCANWSDHGLHTRGSLEGFERIGSSRKWLVTHGGRKWETFYAPDTRALQRRFFDHFLKGEENGWERTPRVRLTVRRSREAHEIRSEAAWPLARAAYTPLYLDARVGALSEQPSVEPGAAFYVPRRRGTGGRVSFVHRFEHLTELTGGMTLRLWVSTSEGDDLDLFVVLRKFTADCGEVFFYGYNGFARDALAKGWLRVSHRELDPALSRPGRPWHTHRAAQPVRPGEIVPVEIEIWPSSTLFEAGSTLRLDILGRDADRYPAFRHGRTVNRGRHTVHTGPTSPSVLLVPTVPAASTSAE